MNRKEFDIVVKNEITMIGEAQNKVVSMLKNAIDGEDAEMLSRALINLSNYRMNMIVKGVENDDEETVVN